MQSTVIGEIACTKIAPLSRYDLGKLKKPQWDHLQTLLLNVGSEEQPVWVVAQKGPVNWVVYLPPFLAGQQAAITNCFPSSVVAQVKVVDYGDNVRLNNIDGLTQEAQWHAVLLARVLLSVPRGRDLATFRNRVPLSLLLQDVHQDCLIVAERKQRSATDAFTYRSPFSNQPLQAIYPEEQKTRTDLLTLNEKLDSRSILEAFDKDVFKISAEEGEEFDTLCCVERKSDWDAVRLQEALMVVYHNGLNRLSYPPLKHYASRFDSAINTIDRLFEYNASLLTIVPDTSQCGDLLSYAYPLQCAARNRFLKGRPSGHLTLAKDNIYIQPLAMDSNRHGNLPVLSRAGHVPRPGFCEAGPAI